MEYRKRINTRSSGKPRTPEFVSKQPNSEGRGIEYFWFEESAEVDPKTFGKRKAVRGFFDTPEARRPTPKKRSWTLLFVASVIIAIVGLCAATVILVQKASGVYAIDRIVIAVANVVVALAPIAYILYMARKAAKDVQD